jgi:hypothetical protein
MTHYAYDIYYLVLRYADRLHTEHWVLLMAFMLLAGWFCLRGFGSRKNY